jgi:hypothetical protein
VYDVQGLLPQGAGCGEGDQMTFCRQQALSFCTQLEWTDKCLGELTWSGEGGSDNMIRIVYIHGEGIVMHRWLYF